MPDKQTDPAEGFRNLITEWERGFDAMANRLMGTEEFSRSMNQLQSMQLGMQKAFTEAMANQLSTFNLPSRDDVLRLGENLRALEKRVANVEELLTRLDQKKSKSGKSAKSGKRKGPPRTKRPPSSEAQPDE